MSEKGSFIQKLPSLRNDNNRAGDISFDNREL